MPLNPKLCQSFFCIKSTRPWLRTASWKHGWLQHLCFGFPIRVTLVTLQTLNKTSTTKLSINFMFNLLTSWQHMATFQRFQSTTTRTYQDRTCRVCPTYSLGSVVNKDVSRCFNCHKKMSEFQVIFFRWISDEVSCTSLMTSPSRENMGNGDRCHRSLSHMAVDLLAPPIYHGYTPKMLYFVHVLRTAKKP